MSAEAARASAPRRDGAQDPRQREREHGQAERERQRRGAPGQPPGGHRGEGVEVRHERRIGDVEIVEQRVAQERRVQRPRGGEGLRLRAPDGDQVGRRGRRRRAAASAARTAAAVTARASLSKGLAGTRSCRLQRAWLRAPPGSAAETPWRRRERRAGSSARRAPRARAGSSTWRSGRRRLPPRDRAGRKREAAVARVREQGPRGQGTAGEAQDPDEARSQRPLLRQTLPAGVSRTRLPGEVAGFGPTMIRKSA